MADKLPSLKKAAGFTSGAKAPPGPQQPLTVWAAYRGASVGQSDSFALYPLWPTEVVTSGGGVTSAGGVGMDNVTASIAQASARAYINWGNGRSVDVFTSAVLAGQGFIYTSAAAATAAPLPRLFSDATDGFVIAASQAASAPTTPSIDQSDSTREAGGVEARVVSGEAATTASSLSSLHSLLRGGGGVGGGGGGSGAGEGALHASSFSTPLSITSVLRAGRPLAPPYAPSPSEVLSGFALQMANQFGGNLLCYAAGGGVENIGLARALNEMLVTAVRGRTGAIMVFPFWPADKREWNWSQLTCCLAVGNARDY